MIIHKYTHETDSAMARVTAEIRWEKSDRRSRRLFYETDIRFADDIRSNPNAWLLASAIPAMQHGEERVLVEGQVCPQIRNGIDTVIQQLSQWYGETDNRPIRIEATDGFVPHEVLRSPRTALFLSGGVDALTSLHCNRRDFPYDHPSAIKDCFFVHGFDIGGYEQLDSNYVNSEHAIQRLTGLAEQVGAALIPIYTNIRHLDDSDDLFYRKWHGAALASVAHLFTGRISDAIIASGSCMDDFGPVGSHPLLDPNYSSASIGIHHDGIYMTRMEKVSLLAQWPAALQTLRACFNAFRNESELNCGRCEKCLRTMTALLILGRLKDCPTYPHDDITPVMLDQLIANPALIRHWNSGSDIHRVYLLLSHTNEYFWRQMAGALRNIGRADLAEVIDMKLAEYQRYLQSRNGRNWRKFMKQTDKMFLGGWLHKLLRPSPHSVWF